MLAITAHCFRSTANCPVTKPAMPVDLFARYVLERKNAVGDLPRLRALVEDCDRIWLIYSHESYADLEGLVPAALGEELDLPDRRGVQSPQLGRSTR